MSILISITPSRRGNLSYAKIRTHLDERFDPELLKQDTGPYELLDKASLSNDDIKVFISSSEETIHGMTSTIYEIYAQSLEEAESTDPLHLTKTSSNNNNVYHEWTQESVFGFQEPKA